MPRTFNELAFTPSVDDLIQGQGGSKITVLTGVNNSGKSAYLKKAVSDRSKLYIGANRFYSFHHLPLYSDNTSDLDNWFNQHQSTHHQQWQNFESSYFNTQTAITRLKDDRRRVLFDVFEELFGAHVSVKPEDPHNEFSNRYISVGDDSLSVTSSGTRLFLGLLAAVMDDRFSAVAIDEPELGLAPVLQRRLADILIRGVDRERLFPHDPHILLTTHSHLFLDRSLPSNNWVVSKAGNLISAVQCKSFSELHDIQFRLLGNELSELLLPDAVVFVEGPTDKAFLELVIERTFPKSKIVIEPCGGHIAARLNYWGSSLGDMQVSPYRLRTFVVYDSVKEAGLEKKCDQFGIPMEHRVEWTGNGIEYCYPLSVLSSIYKVNLLSHGELTISGDEVSCNGIGYKKVDLSRIVCAAMTPEVVVPQEVVTKFLTPLSKALV